MILQWVMVTLAPAPGKGAANACAPVSIVLAQGLSYRDCQPPGRFLLWASFPPRTYPPCGGAAQCWSAPVAR